MKTSISTKRTHQNEYVVEANGFYPLSAQELWSKAGSPNLLAHNCLDLKSFSTPEKLAINNPVKETHVFASIPQQYKGRICHYEEGRLWAMGTHPTTLRWLFGLPHFVQYTFSDQQIKISVRYAQEGILRWPLINRLVNWRMEQAVLKLLKIAN